MTIHAIRTSPHHPCQTTKGCSVPTQGVVLACGWVMLERATIAQTLHLVAAHFCRPNRHSCWTGPVNPNFCLPFTSFCQPLTSLGVASCFQVFGVDRAAIFGADFCVYLDLHGIVVCAIEWLAGVSLTRLSARET